MIKNLIVCLVMFFCSCHCFGDKKKEIPTLEQQFRNNFSMTLPPGCVIVEQLDDRWYVYKWRGMYYKIGGHWRQGFLVELSNYKEN